MSKLEEMNDRLEDEMRASSDKVLHVVADMNRLFGQPLQDLINGYRDQGVVEGPSPADLMLGYSLYMLGQYENLHASLKKPEVPAEAFEDGLIAIITIGAGRLLGHHMKLAGVGNALQSEIKEALSECSSSGKA